MPTPCNACPVGQNDRTGACLVAPEDGTGVGSENRTGVNSFSACLLAKSDSIGGDRLDFLNRGQVIPLGSTPWNAVFPVKHPSLGIFAIASGQNSYYRGELIPLGVWPFFKQVSHKAPPTQIEGGAFLFCLPHEAGP